jgi:hypothetical protein
MNPQGGPAIIEIEIAIEIGKLAGLDFDHDFDFDTDSELSRFENKLALPAPDSRLRGKNVFLRAASQSVPPRSLSTCSQGAGITTAKLYSEITGCSPHAPRQFRVFPCVPWAIFRTLVDEIMKCRCSGIQSGLSWMRHGVARSGTMARNDSIRKIRTGGPATAGSSARQGTAPFSPATVRRGNVPNVR